MFGDEKMPSSNNGRGCPSQNRFASKLDRGLEIACKHELELSVWKGTRKIVLFERYVILCTGPGGIPGGVTQHRL